MPVSSRKAPAASAPSASTSATFAIGFLVILGVFVVYSSPTWKLSESIRETGAVSVTSSGPDAAPPAEAAPARRLDVPGYGPYNCSAQDINDQAHDWGRTTGNNKGRWTVHCAGNNATDAIHAVSPGRKGKVFVDIGANKGVRSRGAGLRLRWIEVSVLPSSFLRSTS
jgi:hypothetical protein